MPITEADVILARHTVDFATPSRIRSITETIITILAPLTLGFVGFQIILVATTTMHMHWWLWTGVPFLIASPFATTWVYRSRKRLSEAQSRYAKLMWLYYGGGHHRHE